MADDPSQSVDPSSTDAHQSFADLYGEIARPLHAWAELRVRGPLAQALTAEDLAQEIAYRAYRDFDGFDPSRGTFRAWVFTVANRVAQDILRKVARRAAIGPGPVTGSGVTNLPANVTSISRRVARDEGMRTFLTVMDTLDETERRLLLFRGLEGLGHDDVARLLDVSVEAAKKRWQRLLDRLDRSLPDDLVMP